MAEYIDREAAIKLIAEDRVELTPMHLEIGNAVGGYTIEQVFDGINQTCDRHIEFIKSVPAADVITRDDGIRIGAELAAMHGSDATSQDLEKAYWRGFEDAMQKRDVQPVKHGWWKWSEGGQCSECGFHNSNFGYNYCPNCGTKMDGGI